MATFSVNQARQLYVADYYKTDVTSADNKGTIAPKVDNKKNHLYFQYKGANNLMRSDLIDIKNIIYAKATDANDMRSELKGYVVTLTDGVKDGKPVVGQDYILRIAFKQYIGMSDADQTTKYGMVHVNSTIDSASKFYKELALSLAKNFSKEVTPLLKFALVVQGEEDVENATPVEATTKAETLTGTYTGVLIKEVEQDWVLGTKPLVPVNFEILPGTIKVNGDEVIWGKAEIVEAKDKEDFVHNGKNIADLEYFCMGERGDVYRGAGYPNTVKTQYLVKPENPYNVIDIHYAYVGSNESVQKSEKTITIVVPKIGATNSVSNTLTNNIITQINTIAGLNINKLDTSAVQ